VIDFFMNLAPARACLGLLHNSGTVGHWIASSVVRIHELHVSVCVHSSVLTVVRHKRGAPLASLKSCMTSNRWRPSSHHNSPEESVRYRLFPQCSPATDSGMLLARAFFLRRGRFTSVFSDGCRDSFWFVL